MKNIKSFLSGCLLSAVVLYACKSDVIGPVSTDKTPPNPVMQPVAVGQPGAAEISYTLPDDQQLSYVRAEFVINGVKKEAKSSFYKRSVRVEGFGDTLEHTVTLYTVSRSEVSSLPVQVKVKPLPPAIWNVRNSIRAAEAFGGLQVEFTNPDRGKIVVGTLLWDPVQKEWRLINNFYFGLDSGRFTVRGLRPVKQLFGIFIKDRWDNRSDTLKTELTPIYEEQLDREKFVSMLKKKVPIPQVPPLPKTPGVKVQEPTNLSSWPIENMWNGIVGNEGYHTTENKDVPIFIPIDLGVKAMISRYKIWQRQSDYIFNHGNPHEWELWGTNTPNDVNSWIKLDHQVMEKPSGLPLGQKTTEDVDLAAAGQEYELPAGTPAVRYVAWKHIDSWAAQGGIIGHLHISEIAFWGQITR
ncbi:DUF5000 domain-containing lipoprotein [Chitinophaga solisilvae]|uniref:DUF4959 domain-containing protein n=1 Tax=Chitinophaga solisilvae TaxID=1233460 RepID=A0A3S1BIH2_9BACT|nr:DUF5000 domain-containing lipoprotein [Chitinophaga solisilvae]NSL90380.1 DUF4959 domain-containing protein [Chitinophaga solisilvae]